MISPSPILVVTPTLGVSSYLEETVNSVRALDLPVQHLLACPAGKVEELRRRFPDCAVTADAGREGGIYGALNRGLEAAAKGWQWFTYINDDDSLTAGFASTARQLLRGGSSAKVTYGDVRLIDPQSQTIAFISTERDPARLPLMLHQNMSPLNQQGMLFHHTVVESLRGFNTTYRLCADLDFWARALVKGFPFQYFPLEVGRFRVQPGQLSGDVSLTDREIADIVKTQWPSRPSARQLWFARMRYRFVNLPRYAQRCLHIGWKTSAQMLTKGNQ